MHEIEERGSKCPGPVLALGKFAASADPGTEVALISDDPASAIDIPAWCRMRSATIVSTTTLPDGATRFVIALAS